MTAKDNVSAAPLLPGLALAAVALTTAGSRPCCTAACTANLVLCWSPATLLVKNIMVNHGKPIQSNHWNPSNAFIHTYICVYNDYTIVHWWIRHHKGVVPPSSLPYLNHVASFSGWPWFSTYLKTVELETSTIWLFNIAVENHHF